MEDEVDLVVIRRCKKEEGVIARDAKQIVLPSHHPI
jgi:hypothetical protein